MLTDISARLLLTGLTNSCKMSTTSGSAAATTAERALRNALQVKHVKELWIFLGCVIGFLSIVNFTRRLFNIVYKSTSTIDAPSSEKKDVEDGGSSKTLHYSIRRLPSAMATGFRILAFRLSIPIAPGSILSISELTFILIYIAAMLIWLLVDSKPSGLYI